MAFTGGDSTTQEALKQTPHVLMSFSGLPQILTYAPNSLGSLKELML